jgi:hypothetical protein
MGGCFVFLVAVVAAISVSVFSTAVIFFDVFLLAAFAGAIASSSSDSSFPESGLGCVAMGFCFLGTGPSDGEAEGVEASGAARFCFLDVGVAEGEEVAAAI